GAGVARVAWGGLDHLAGSDVPDAALADADHVAIALDRVAAPGGERLAVRAEGDGPHRVGVAEGAGQAPAGPRVPQPRPAVVTARQPLPAVGAEGAGGDGGGMTERAGGRPPGRGTVQPRLLAAGREDRRAVGAERGDKDLFRLAGELHRQQRPGDAPESGR